MNGNGYISPNELILVYGSLRVGGIETMIVRVANFYARSGCHVSVCCTAGGELEALLDPKVSVIKYNSTKDLIRAIRLLESWRNGESRVLMISFDPISAARALMVEAKLDRRACLTNISGVFHPRAYFMTGERRDRVWINRLLARAFGKSRFFFMNEECLSSHALRWNESLEKCSILPLPIDDVGATWSPSHSKAIRIISVGRLVDFKAYNLGAAKTVRACLDRGIDVSWSIYGEGPLRDSVESEINVFGVQSFVGLQGTLAYENFAKEVVSYDLFIGMGTAALEAAMLGVPTICATVDMSTGCYGYIQDLPFGNVGERLKEIPSIEFDQLIEAYHLATDEDRWQLSCRSRAAAEKYGMREYAFELSQISELKDAGPPWLFKLAVAEMYRLITESLFARTLRRSLLNR